MVFATILTESYEISNINSTSAEANGNGLYILLDMNE